MYAEHKPAFDVAAYARSQVHRHVVSRLLASYEGIDKITGRHRFKNEDAAHVFARALLQGKDIQAFMAVADDMPDAKILTLIPLVARRLEAMWQVDECSFFDVTLAMGALCRLVHEIGIGSHGSNKAHSPGQSILLTSLPTNQHTLGLRLVEAAFHSAGWTVLSLQATDALSVVDVVRSTWFSAVGISIASPSDAEETSDMIAALRDASKNDAIVILIGGAYINSNPKGGERADATAFDPSSAVKQCGHLVRANMERLASRGSAWHAKH